MKASLYDSLRRDIQDAKLRPGGKLPSSRALAKQLGISRTTVLDVYHQLALDGLVSARTGSGTRVTGSPLTSFISGSHYPVQPLEFIGPDGVRFCLHR